MTNMTANDVNAKWPTLGMLPTPAKALVTATLIVLAIGMTGALGQIVVHDIIPTFFRSAASSDHGGITELALNKAGDSQERGDLFSELVQNDAGDAHIPLYHTEQFVWLLKWTHIHLFGMSMIFIFLGSITIFLNIGLNVRIWLVALPFAGVLIDIAAMWLKAYVSPGFFWLHVPGGGLFAMVFTYVCIKALGEMWGRSG